MEIPAVNVSPNPPGMRKTPVVLGILNIVFGALVAVWSLFGLIGQSFASGMFDMMSSFGKMIPKTPGMPDVSQLYAQMKVLMEEMKPYFSTILIVKALLSMALVGIGWGLYRRLAAHRRWVLIWSVAALAVNLGEGIFQLAVYLPRMHLILDELYKNMPMGSFQSSMQSTGGTAGVVGGLLFYSVYPILLLALMGRASAKNDLI